MESTHISSFATLRYTQNDQQSVQHQIQEVKKQQKIEEEKKKEDRLKLIQLADESQGSREGRPSENTDPREENKEIVSTMKFED